MAMMASVTGPPLVPLGPCLPFRPLAPMKPLKIKRQVLKDLEHPGLRIPKPVRGVSIFLQSFVIMHRKNLSLKIQYVEFDITVHPLTIHRKPNIKNKNEAL